MALLLASGFTGSFPFINFMIGFIILICFLVVVIVGVKWALSELGLTIPRPLLIMASVVIFLILFLVMLNWLRIYSF